MSRSVGDINAKIAYLTNKKTGPLLKAKRPLVLKYNPKRLEIKGEPCHKELGQLLECVSQHDDNAKCSQQFIALATCHEKQGNLKDSQMKRLLQGEKVDGRYHPNVLKKLLAKYPECHNIKGLHIQRNLLNSLDESKRKPVPFNDPGRPYNKKSV